MSAPDHSTGRIRSMTSADVPAVDALEHQLFPVDAWPRQMFHDELAQSQTRHYLVAEDALGMVVGYAGLMVIEPVGDIQTLAVTPEREGQGIGSQLLNRLLDEARARAAADVLLEVRSDNPRAQQLYRRFGFEQISLRKRYYRDGVDALVMKLDLRSAHSGTMA